MSNTRSDRVDRVLDRRRAVDDLVGAELADEREADRRRRADHVRPVRARKLDREPADRPGGAVDQDAFSRGQPPVVEQPLPGAERRKRDRGALGVLDRPRLADEQLGGHRRVVGGDAVTVERREREHPVAGREPGHVRAELSDDAGELVGRDRGQPVDGPLQLAAGDRGRPDADECLPWAGRRALGLFDARCTRVEQSAVFMGVAATAMLASAVLG